MSEIPRYWRLKETFLKLQGEQCPHCEEKIFPPRDICPGCGDLTIPQISEHKGTVTKVHVESTYVPGDNEKPGQFKSTTQTIVRLENGTEVPIISRGSERMAPGSFVDVVGISDKNPRETKYFSRQFPSTLSQATSQRRPNLQRI